MSEQNKISNEQLILEAAELEFFTKGYDGARTTSIAKKAELHMQCCIITTVPKRNSSSASLKTINTVKQTMLAAMGNRYAAY